VVRKEIIGKISAGIPALVFGPKEEFYKDLEHKIENSTDNEISTTDPDARMMDNKKNGLEVNYNVQIAVDSKNKLILATEVTNKPSDQGHLNDMAQAAKETLGIGENGTLKVTADKGYYQAEDLIACDENGTETYITHQTYSNATGNPEYYSNKFKYDSSEDVYICPEGQKLYRTNHKAEKPDQIKYKISELAGIVLTKISVQNLVKAE
jgi:hypothetical protein